MKRPSQQLHHRAGFTLLEVLIALALSVMLISAVFGAINIHYRYQNAGQAEMRGANLLRGISTKANQDFNSILMQNPAVEAPPPEDGAAGEDTGTTVIAVDQGLSPTIAESLEPVPFGLFGTQSFMHLTVSIPTRNMSQTGLYGGELNGRLSDTMIVSYGLCPIDQNNLRILSEDLQVARPAQGMARRELELFNMPSATDQIGPEWLQAPEVTELMFEYFDGATWTATWDSRATNTLPTAIRFTMGVWNPPPKSMNALAPATGTGTVTLTQYIYHVPASVPVSVTSAAAAAPATTP